MYIYSFLYIYIHVYDFESTSAEKGVVFDIIIHLYAKHKQTTRRSFAELWECLGLRLMAIASPCCV